MTASGAARANGPRRCVVWRSLMHNWSVCGTSLPSCAWHWSAMLRNLTFAAGDRRVRTLPATISCNTHYRTKTSGNRRAVTGPRLDGPRGRIRTPIGADWARIGVARARVMRPHASAKPSLARAPDWSASLQGTKSRSAEASATKRTRKPDLPYSRRSSRKAIGSFLRRDDSPLRPHWLAARPGQGRSPAIDLDTGSALARVSGRNEPSVVDQQQTMLNADALGFAILMLLALGTLSPMGCSCAELERTHLHPQTSR
jgi:hypothetical protein